MKHIYRSFVLALALVLGTAGTLHAQQQQMFTQYMFNQLALNPAYAGTDKAANITALTRHQWLGVDGAPTTQTISMHAPFPKRKIGLGLQLINDRVGPINQFGLYASYAYLIPMSIGTLSAGLQAGFNTYREDLTSLRTGDVDDAFGTVVRDFLPNAGVGVWFTAENWYAGASLPQMLNHDVGNAEGGVTSTQIRHWFVTGGYVFPVSTDIKLKPNVLMKVVQGAPVQFDLNMNVLFQEVLWAGVSWRSFDSFDFLLEVLLTPQLRLGYAYDTSTSRLRLVNTGSHEIMLNYRLAFEKDRLLTPRYF
ncbi:MAG: type IX secretion system membrane protein PorP/SprF [Bacteroidota bacterium]